MKRKSLVLISLIFVMLISCFGLVACAHKHEFTIESATEQYLATEATCTEKATYYYSCECGEKGTETFEYGELAAHEHTIIKNSETEHWYECVCGDKATAEAHKGGTATCTAKAVCEVCNASYGELLAHSYTELKHNATEHWYECVCGDKATAEAHKGGEATCTAQALCEVCNTAYGALLPHEYVTTEFKKNETEHWYECACGAKDAIESHTGGTATCTEQAICEDCGEDYGALAPHNHTELKHNETEHWLECVCGDKATAEAHAYTIFKQNENQKWYECACGAIDSRYLIDVDAEVLMSLNSKKLFFNNTSLEGAEIIGIIYNGNSILTDGVLDVSAFAINQATPYVLHIETSLNRYALNNVVAYTEVFENTKESRELMAKTFYTPDYDFEAEAEGQRYDITGSYALVENIYFDHNAYDEEGNLREGKYSDREMFYNAVSSQTIDGEKVYYMPNVFKGTFDGRGYTLNDVLMHYGNYQTMFGIAGDGAVIKNVAINNVYAYKNTTTITDGSGKYAAVLFYDIESNEAVVTLENVYVYRYVSASSGYYGLLTYGADDNDSFGKSIFKNVVLQTAYDDPNTVYEGGHTNIIGGITKKGEMTLTDAYFISNGRLSRANSTVKGFTKYSTVADMKAAGNDYSTFDSKYWAIVDGVPVWYTCSNIVTLVDAEEETISSIVANGAYTVGVISDGKVAEVGVTTSSESEYVTCNGTSVVVAVVEGVKLVESINVYLDGKLVGAIEVIVDNRVAVVVNEEILVSKANGKLYLNGTSVKDVSVINATYNGVSVYADGTIDVDAIEVAVNTAFTLEVTTEENAYTFTNVKMYDGVYAQDNRAEFIELFNFTGELNGYYVLAENITFAEEDGTFNCHTKEDVFGGTLDGRGYTISNIYFPGASVNAYGVFGGIPGANTAIKNISINRLFRGSDEGAWGSGNHGSLFFRNGAEGAVVTMENVYVYVKFTATSSPGRYFYTLIYGRSGDNLTTYNLTNVIIVNEFAADTAEGETDSCGNTSNCASLGYAEIPGTATDTYYIANSKNYKKHTYEGLTSYGDGTCATIDLVIAKMAADYAEGKINYNTFDTKYWTVVDGVPTWNTLPVVAE